MQEYISFLIVNSRTICWLEKREKTLLLCRKAATKFCWRIEKILGKFSCFFGVFGCGVGCVFFCTGVSCLKKNTKWYILICFISVDQRQEIWEVIPSNSITAVLVPLPNTFVTSLYLHSTALHSPEGISREKENYSWAERNHVCTALAFRELDVQVIHGRKHQRDHSGLKDC